LWHQLALPVAIEGANEVLRVNQLNGRTVGKGSGLVGEASNTDKKPRSTTAETTRSRKRRKAALPVRARSAGLAQSVMNFRSPLLVTSSGASGPVCNVWPIRF
jgi:hypothetical protein